MRWPVASTMSMALRVCHVVPIPKTYPPSHVIADNGPTFPGRGGVIRYR